MEEISKENKIPEAEINKANAERERQMAEQKLRQVCDILTPFLQNSLSISDHGEVLLSHRNKLTEALGMFLPIRKFDILPNANDVSVDNQDNLTKKCEDVFQLLRRNLNVHPLDDKEITSIDVVVRLIIRFCGAKGINPSINKDEKEPSGFYTEL
jgi:hypothetical protein